MPTVVDSLVVTLGLDPTNFTKGQKDAADALIRTKKEASTTAKEMQASGAQASEFFSKVKVEALSLFGILLGAKGVESFVRDTTKSLSDLGRQARNIGEAAGPVEAFAMAIERMGGSAANARGVLQQFAQSKAEFQTFGKGNFGVDMALIGGNLDTSPLEAIQKFQAFIERTKDQAGGIQKINLLGKELFGFDEGTMNAMIQMGTVAKLNKELGESYKLGVPTPEMIERATRFQIALEKLGQAAKYDGEVMLNGLYPAITAVTDALANSITNNPAALAGWSALGGLIATLTTLSALRISASSMGLTGLASVLETIALLAGRLGLIGAAGLTTYEALHIGGLNEGEENTPGYAGRFGVAPGGANGADSSPASADETKMLGYISQLESGNENIPNYRYDSSHTAGGYWQITDTNWRAYAPQVGIDVAKYPNAMAAPRSIQEQVALSMLRKEGPVPWDKAHGGPLPTGLYWPKASGNQGGARPNIPPPPRPLPSSAAPANGGNTHVAIGSIAVHTQATDANGIAQDLNGAIVVQSNRGAN